ncbi:MAG TPA: hypothetical protein VKW08_16790 [Xanthobacteraceae bacterium]|jgi:hypothetical protein|nr:hypothetical protein [Xanthobacteraceae bacterium]
MSQASSPTGASLWRQDVNWYVQQQSWTRPFYRADQSWNQKLQASNLTAPPPSGQTGSPNLAEQKLANLIDPQTEQGLIDSFQSTSITVASGQVTSGYLLNMLA